MRIAVWGLLVGACAPEVSPRDLGEVVAGAPRVCLDEIMPSNQGAVVVDDATPDYVVLVNAGDAPVSLADWWISDDEDQPARWVLSDELSVPPGGRLVLYADGDDALGPDHLPFKLDADGEELVLTDPEGHVDAVAWTPMAADDALVRQTPCCEAASCWSTEAGPTERFPEE